MRFPWLIPGTKVVCVEADFALVQGAIYTIHSVEPNPDGDLFLTLKELQEEGTRHWWPERFRPLVPDASKTIEALKQMMRDHVKSASGGLGITPRKVRA